MPAFAGMTTNESTALIWSDTTLESCRQPDRQPRAGFDRRAQRRRRVAPALHQSRIAMLSLIGAELFERRLEVGLGIAQGLDLARVMLVDHFFDRDGASHRRALAQHRRRRAQGEAGRVP